MASSLFGGSKQTTTQDPWAAQQPYIKDAFGQAQNLYNSKQGTPFYQGEMHAGLDPLTSSGIASTGAYASGTGADSAAALSSSGASLLGSHDDYLKAIGAYGTAASTDPTQGNIASAGAYANNPFLDGQINAASRDVSRNLYENQLPGIDQAATGLGGINSSRAGVAQGIAMRGAQDQIGDISAQMRGNAYNQGLGLAEQGRETNLSAMGNNAGLYGNAFGQGVNATGAGNQMALGNLDAQVRAGQIGQQDQQGLDDANFARWQGNDTRQQDLLNNYYSLIGNKSWGGTTTQTQQSNPGILGGILGAASTGAGIYKTLSGAGLFGK